MVGAAATLLLLLLTAEVRSETVDIRYRGPVDLKTFECRDINRSSFIQRVCYDKAQSYMIISLKATYYHYCELPPATFDGFMGAPSMGQFFSQNIKGSGSDGPYDCRTHRVPKLSYLKYYNEVRTHLSLEKDAPVSRAVELAGHVLCRPILGGLHHQYVRI